MDEIIYTGLSVDDLHPALLQTFIRYQETNRAWIPEISGPVLKDTFFIDDWDDAKKARVIQHFADCICSGGAVIGAVQHEKLIGFACIEGKAFGSQGQYRELTYIHVSQELRGKGIGKRLFARISERARQLDTDKLYISAHPAEETQAFYKSMGCIPAEEINPVILAREPLDLQLEFKIMT